MKKFKLLIVAIITLFALNVSANDNPPIKATEQLRTEMMDLIGTTCPFEYNKNECWASVIFVVNSNDEIEILSVVSKNKNDKIVFIKKIKQ